MKNWKPVVAPVLVFLLGAICGGGAMALYALEKVARIAEGAPAETSEVGVRTLARRLQLDAEQRAAARPILFNAARDLARLRRDSMPEARAVINDATRQLRPLLRPDQERRLDQMLAQPRARWDLLESERKRDRARPPASTAPP